MLDRYGGIAPVSNGPAIDAFNIVPNDTSELSEVTRAIFVGQGGTITAVTNRVRPSRLKTSQTAQSYRCASPRCWPATPPRSLWWDQYNDRIGSFALAERARGATRYFRVENAVRFHNRFRRSERKHHSNSDIFVCKRTTEGRLEDGTVFAPNTLLQSYDLASSSAKLEPLPVIYGGQWRGSDRFPLGRDGPLRSMVAPVFFSNLNGYMGFGLAWQDELDKR